MSLLFDVETLGKESTTVVLSASLLYVDFDTEFTYEELLEKTVFVKFNAIEQIEKYNRTKSKDTIEWWEQQNQATKEKSFFPKKSDLSVEDGMDILRSNYKKNTAIWIRGSLDGMAIDSLATAANIKPWAPWYMYRDIRTFIDLMKDTSKYSYCDIPGFDKDKMVVKHDPCHDVAYDAYMMKYGI